MYIVINTLSVYECVLKKEPKCIEKSYDFCADGEKICVSPTLTVKAIKISQENMVTKLQVNK
jgi:hypothetical protein